MVLIEIFYIIRTGLNMNLNHLHYFIVLAETQHYGRAAERLNISQPSLTYAISQLEEELGVSLFERKGRTIHLSRLGVEFLKYVKSSLSILESGQRALQEGAKSGGYINIGSIRTLATVLVPSLMKDFKALTPYPFTFHLTTMTGFSSSILKAVEEKTVDFGFTTTMGNPDIYETIAFTYSRFVAVAPDGHPLTKKRSAAIDEILDYPQILFSPRAGLRKSIDALFSNTDKTPRIAFETEEDDVVLGLVNSGFGVAVLPYEVLIESLSVKIIEIEGADTSRKAYLSRLKGIKLPQTAENFWSFSKEKLSSVNYIDRKDMSAAGEK